MTVSPQTGKLIHHNNCTWCKHRRGIQVGARRKKRELERCALTGADIPPPFMAVYPNSQGVPDRYCERYQQIGCPCERCMSEIVVDKENNG
jgi:hypothetical protein